MRIMTTLTVLAAAAGLSLSGDHASLGRSNAPRSITFSTTVRVPGDLVDSVTFAQCVNQTVQCNWAKFYSGTFGWSHSIIAPKSEHYENVTVSLSPTGQVGCNGGVREIDNGRTTTGSITGNGLLGIQFQLDSMNAMTYRIIGACPSVAGMGSPVRPADLDDNSMETYQQPANVGQGQPILVGSSVYPAPETDPVNSVTGQVRVSWSFHKHP